MDYSQLSDFELSSKILRIIYSDILDSYDMHVLDCCEEAPSLAVAMGHPIDVFEFDINNPSDIMPLMIEHEIDIEWNQDECCAAKYYTRPDDIHWHDKNPYRAIAICFLKMQEAKNA